ncbi:YfiT family bacillithiol transferase [Aurantibacter sp.]|uniref:YfiT family bacillithiol transferase n=1 Tax=Aurantibacter sp. TaxID=2807103 RepID=UPI00326779AC
MDAKEIEKLKYPIGKFEMPTEITSAILLKYIDELEVYPGKLSNLVSDLDEQKLSTAYRPGGWTVRQLVHHIADSHHHSYTRFKWALTENKALIKAYEEKEWSKLFDAKTAPIQLSLTYLSALHAKIVYLLRGLSDADLNNCYTHPEDEFVVTVAENICKYAWHGRHHYAHIKNLIEREGWR